MHRCHLCGSSNLSPAFSIDRVPRDIQNLLTRDRLGQDLSTRFQVWQCLGCDLVQGESNLEDSYYDDYLMSQTFSPKLQNYLNDLVAHFLDRYSGANIRVIDVGCGDGAFMLPWQQRGIEVHGIEPSARSRDLARAAGLDVEAGYMTPETKLSAGPFDVFVTRQVLEHVADIRPFLQGIYNNTTPQAWGIIEVPRLEKALEDHRFYDFFPDHVNYFSLATLARACHTNGFEVIESLAGMDEEYNIVIVRKRQRPDLAFLAQSRQSTAAAIQELFAQHRDGGCAVWGAGAKGLSILSAMDTENVAMLVDSDINKIGRFTPVSEIEVQPPEDLLKQGMGLVLITAVAYQDRIMEKLRGMGFAGAIYLLTPQGVRPA